MPAGAPNEIFSTVTKNFRTLIYPSRRFCAKTTARRPKIFDRDYRVKLTIAQAHAKTTHQTVARKF